MMTMTMTDNDDDIDIDTDTDLTVAYILKCHIPMPSFHFKKPIC